MGTTAFSFTAPEGWQRSGQWGQRNDASIVDAAGNEITVYSWTTSATAQARCDVELKVLKIWVPGEISSLPPITMGGSPAPGGTLSGESFYELRCASRDGVVYNLALKAKPADRDRAVAALRAVAGSWQWK